MIIKSLHELKGNPCTEKFFDAACLEATTFTSTAHHSHIGDEKLLNFSCYTGQVDDFDRGILYTQNTIFQSGLFNVFSLEEGWRLADERFDYCYRGYRDHYSKLIDQQIPKSPLSLKGNTCLIVGQWGTEYYHFIHETIPKLVMMSKLNLLEAMDHFVLPQSAPNYVMDWLTILQIPHQKVLRLTDKLFFKAESLYIPTQFTITGKTSVELRNYLSLYANMACKHEAKQNIPKKLFVNRRGSRQIGNIADWNKNHLKSLNYVEIFPEDYSCLEQYKLFSSADIIVAPHGGNMANIIFSNANIIELLGVDYNNTCYCDAASLFQNPYYYMACKEDSDGLEVEWKRLFDYLQFLK